MKRAALAIGLLLMVGCQSSPPAAPKAKARDTGGDFIDGVAKPKGTTLNPEQLLLTDPCAGRLQDIGGAMLLYYSLNRTLPQKLDDLKGLADIDAPLNFTCPVTGQPYQYAPEPLRAPGLTRLLVVYDAAPSHNGRRWCILIAEPKPGKPLATWVEQLPEPIFHSYAPVER